MNTAVYCHFALQYQNTEVSYSWKIFFRFRVLLLSARNHGIKVSGF